MLGFKLNHVSKRGYSSTINKWLQDIFGPEPEEEDEFNDETSREHPHVEDVRLDEAAAKWLVFAVITMTS